MFLSHGSYYPLRLGLIHLWKYFSLLVPWCNYFKFIFIVLWVNSPSQGLYRTKWQMLKCHVIHFIWWICLQTWIKRDLSGERSDKESCAEVEARLSLWISVHSEASVPETSLQLWLTSSRLSGALWSLLTATLCVVTLDFATAFGPVPTSSAPGSLSAWRRDSSTAWN